MKFGLLYWLETFTAGYGLEEHNSLWEILTQVEVADSLGFALVWGVGDHGLRGSSLRVRIELFHACLGPGTKHIRIGHSAPLRTSNALLEEVEQLIVLNVLSNGRGALCINLCSPGHDSTVTWEQLREALPVVTSGEVENAQACRRRIATHTLSLNIVPTEQQSHQSLWLACLTPDTYAFAGNCGLGVLSHATNWEYVQENLLRYREAQAGRSHRTVHVVPEPFAVLAFVHVCENKAEEQAGVAGARWFLEQVITSSCSSRQPKCLSGSADLWRYFALRREPQHLSEADIKAHPMVILGDLDDVICKLEPFAQGGVDQIICCMPVGRIPHPNLVKSLKRVRNFILPHFASNRAATV